MKQRFQFLFFFILVFTTGHSQPSEDVNSEKIVKAFNETSVSKSNPEVQDSISNVIATLGNRIENLEELERKSKLQEYNSKYIIVKNELLLLDEIRATLNAIASDREIMKANTYMAKLNNPTDSVLGFSFVDIVMENLELSIDEYINDAVHENNAAVNSFKSKKETFFSRIKNILDVVAPIFPPLQVIANITDKVENLTEPIKVWPNNKPSSNAKNLIIQNQSVFEPKLIKSFYGKMNSYITYYQKLASTNDVFLSELKTHEIEYNSFSRSILEKIEKMEQLTAITLDNPGNIINQTDAVFEKTEPNKNTSFYRKINNKPTVKFSIAELREVLDMVHELNDMHNDFQLIVLKNYDNYISSLKASLILEKTQKQKVEDLIDTMEMARNGDDKDDLKNGFINKYSKNLSNLNTYLYKINLELDRN